MRLAQALGTLLLLALSTLRHAHAEVQVLVGPTPILNGSANSPGDITVRNEKLAFAIAVNSSMPYGVPRGAIVDVAPVVNGQIGRDRVVFADFIPNHWSAWPNTYQHVEIVERGSQRAVIRAVRDWGAVTIATSYTLEAGVDAVDIRTTMTNNGATALPDLLSGLTLWPSAGYYFSVPGTEGIDDGKAVGALSDRASAYDSDWSVTLHAPYLSHIGAGSKDLYLRHTLAPGASRSFEGWLQVGTSGDLAPVLRSEIEHRKLEAGTIRGWVREKNGQAVAQPVVVVEKQGKVYGWVIGQQGRYELQVPSGQYSLSPQQKISHKASRRRCTLPPVRPPRLTSARCNDPVA